MLKYFMQACVAQSYSLFDWTKDISMWPFTFTVIEKQMMDELIHRDALNMRMGMSEVRLKVTTKTWSRILWVGCDGRQVSTTLTGKMISGKGMTWWDWFNRVLLRVEICVGVTISGIRLLCSRLLIHDCTMLLCYLWRVSLSPGELTWQCYRSTAKTIGLQALYISN